MACGPVFRKTVKWEVARNLLSGYFGVLQGMRSCIAKWERVNPFPTCEISRAIKRNFEMGMQKTIVRVA